MPLRYKQRLLSHMAHDAYTPTKVETLAADLGFDDLEEFRDAVEQMAAGGDLEVSHKGAVRLISIWDLAQRDAGHIEGRFSRARKGFGFVRPDVPVRGGDLYIPARSTGDAMTGDIVRVQVKKDKRAGRGAAGAESFVGEITEIIERKQANFTGTIEKRGHDWVVNPDGKTITDPIVVRDAESKNVKDGDKVVVEITEYPEDDYLAEGVIVKVLGDAGRPDVETEAVIAAYDLPPNEFPEDCVQQARDITKKFNEDIDRFLKGGASALPDRRDMTGDFVCTIDPPDAKDYDDAIAIKRVKDGWEVFVHIADVGTFIERDSPLDLEARDRANSCYLPRLVIPMLPEILSNGICSLQEGVERFVKTAIIRYDRHGNVTAQGVSNSIIKSRKRMTYLEAQALIDGDLEEARKHAKTDTEHTDELIGVVKEMNACAKAIQGPAQAPGHDQPRPARRRADLRRRRARHRRRARGRRLHPHPHRDVHGRGQRGPRPPLRGSERPPHPAHPPGPQPQRRRAPPARRRRRRLPRARAPDSREEIQGLIEATRGKPPARAVHMAVLRTLTKAEYSPALIGHFALASEAYAHFTSPIRRYADLTVHRALAEYLRQTDNAESRPKSEGERRKLGKSLLETDACPHESELVAIARHCTMREQNAEDAERELRQFLVLQLLEKHIGETFKGLITGVTNRGVFVQLDKYLADGMVAKEDLPGDTTRDNRRPTWKVDNRTGALVDQASGRSFNMGDTVDVSIAKIDLARRQMDLVIVNADSRAAGKAKKVPELTLGGGHRRRARPCRRRRIQPAYRIAQRRSQKSKSRDKNKKDYRQERKNKRR